MPAFSPSMRLSRFPSIRAAASRFGEKWNRFRVPSAVRTSAAHFAAGFRYFLPSVESGYSTAFRPSRTRTCGLPSR
jgi:hypothetical protein